jgi:hypothetical protein
MQLTLQVERLRGKSKAKTPIGKPKYRGSNVKREVWNTEQGRRWNDSLTQGTKKFGALVNVEVNFLVP